MTQHPDRDSASSASESAATEPARRNFVVSLAALICGAIVSLAPVVVGAVSFLNPLGKRPPVPKKYRDKGGDGPAGFIRVTSLETLPINGNPQRFPVIDDLRDSWNFIPDQPVGAVFVQRTGEDQVIAFNATCPHAGCSVSFRDNAYLCPCHNSAFDLDGEKLTQAGKENPSPRPLDKLEVDAQRLADGEVWVRFVNYYTGKEKQIPKT